MNGGVTRPVDPAAATHRSDMFERRR